MEGPKGPGPDLKRKAPLPVLAGPYGSPSRRPQGCHGSGPLDELQRLTVLHPCEISQNSSTTDSGRRTYHTSMERYLCSVHEIETCGAGCMHVAARRPRMGCSTGKRRSYPFMHDQYVVQYANSAYELYAEFGIN
eukprot:COSAG02_NODE_50_length_44860_cov_203.992739_40_plen_135_part_00